jgi:hypothetical protein
MVAATAVVGLGGLGASEVVVPAGPVGAAGAGCSSGVIVAADFSPWVPDTVNSVCDPGLPPNAAQALVDTGFDPVGVSTYPPLAFICTIAGYPRGEDCSTTPPGNAYWSFWYANGATWTYSELGATALTPVAGSVEYWEFGGASASNPPTTTPAALRSSTSTTTTTTTTDPTATTPSTAPPASTAVPVAGAPTGSAGGSGGGGPGNGTSHSPSVSGGGTTTTGAQTFTGASGTPGSSKSGKPDGSSSTQAVTGSPTRPSPSATRADRGTGGSVQGPTIVNAAPVVATEDSPGSSAPFTLGAVGIAVLAGTGGLIAWRRRRTG